MSRFRTGDPKAVPSNARQPRWNDCPSSVTPPLAGSIRAAAFMPRGHPPHEWGGSGMGSIPATPPIMRVEALWAIRRLAQRARDAA
jgi:hypothetical protein